MLEKQGKVLYDFHAVFCGPCRRMNAVLQAASIPDDVKVIKVDVQDSVEMAEEYGIKSVPVLVYEEDGKEIWRNTGILHLPDLEKKFL